MDKQRGTALIEFALVVPFILVMMFTVIEFGRAMQRYNGAVKVARDAVRYLSMQQQGTHMNEARYLIVYGKTTRGSDADRLDADLTEAMVPDPQWQVTGENPLINTVTVTIRGYQYQPMAGSVFGVLFPTFTFDDIQATMRCPL